MNDATRSAERIIRRFARETNLLVGARPVHVTGATEPADAAAGAVADALVRMLAALGARPIPTAEVAGLSDAERTKLLEIELGHPVDDPAAASFRLGGRHLGSRGDAAGRIDFAGAHMPVSRRLADELATRGTVRGMRIGIAMVLEPKTAQLALMLAGAGADVAVYAHPDETDPDVAAALRERGIPVDADPTLAGAAERDAALAFLARGFDVVIDDGSHLIRLAHELAPHLVDGWIGANEETTSGLTPLRLMQSGGVLRTGVLAVNDARMKTRFDNRYGTGQSCVFAIADVLDEAGVTVRDQPALVIGYGPVGQGVAAHLSALGAEVRVTETDPVRALVAVHDGYAVGRADELGADALIVSATGAAHTVSGALARNARVVAVAGGVPHEVDLAEALLEPMLRDGEALPHLEVLRPGGALVLDRGGCINITAAEGNPIEIMDYSFAVQLAAVEHLVVTRPGAGVHPLPASIDDRVARTALAAAGLAVDEPGVAQVEAGHDWRSRRYDRMGGER
ncbi:adenosylhomocysteinase [Agromyces italicus]|uniref:adenosylhomocysteinase n=1 Tax=Agromyces italicus TaxID=279572 RepID=UPI0003B59F4E|nr:adenosylhomocysteinase [Agromyces italicus]